MNSTEQTIELLPSKFLYQIKAYDPDLLLNDQMNIFPPTVEYEIDSPLNIEIDRYTGRIFLTEFNTTKINFTIIIKDFGQPNRFTIREILTFNIKPKENIFISIFLISAASFIVMVIFLSVLIVITNHCTTNHKKKSKSQKKTTWQNISPTTADTRLIDNEYVRHNFYIVYRKLNVFV